MRKAIIHSNLLTHLSRFYPTLCTIQYYAAENRDSYGEPQPVWLTVPDYDDLRCTIAAKGGNEVKMPDMTLAISTHTIALAGFYRLIEPKWRVMLVGFIPPWIAGTIFDILLVEFDSHGTLTRLTVQVVK